MNEWPDHLAALIQMFIGQPFMSASARKILGSKAPDIFTLGRRGDVLRRKLEVCKEALQKKRDW
jgi:hypothetical protein